MVTLREVAQQALKALESCSGVPHWPALRPTINDLRQALEVEQDEPVACGHCCGTGRMVRDPDIGTDQECFVCGGSGFFEDSHTQPAQQPLTDEQIDAAVAPLYRNSQAQRMGRADDIATARAIERAHGIK